MFVNPMDTITAPTCRSKIKVLLQVKNWSSNLDPIANHFVNAYKNFLPKLIYPVRVGEHANSAFGLIFPFEYAKREKAFL